MNALKTVISICVVAHTTTEIFILSDFKNLYWILSSQHFLQNRSLVKNASYNSFHFFRNEIDLMLLE